MSLRYTNIGPRLTLRQPVARPLTAGYLQLLPQTLALKSAYKRLFKLRFLVARGSHQQSAYCNLLRRKFKGNFNLRREKVLGSVSGNPQALSVSELMLRLANTTAFVFNATCETDTPPPTVNFYADLKEATKQRIETDVMTTIIEVEDQKPAWIKYDPTYKWIDQVQAFYEEAKQPLSKKEVNRLTNTKIAPAVGFLQYEQTVMNLNESLDLCL